MTDDQETIAELAATLLTNWRRPLAGKTAVSPTDQTQIEWAVNMARAIVARVAATDPPPAPDGPDWPHP